MLAGGEGSMDRWGKWGRYQLRGDAVRVWVSQAWTDVCCRLRAMPSNRALDYGAGDWGTYMILALEGHVSSALSNFEENSHNLVWYEVTEHCCFPFRRDRRL